MARPPAWRRGPLVGLAALLVLLAAAYLSGVAGPEGTGADGRAQSVTSSGSSPSSAGSPSAGPSSAPRDPVSGLPVVDLDRLPSQVADTLDLIVAGGPFPEDEDGGTFGNREGLLPDQVEGWYREYTVPTPGSPDRGARRVVAGADGTFYFTADHYDSFVVVGGVG